MGTRMLTLFSIKIYALTRSGITALPQYFDPLIWRFSIFHFSFKNWGCKSIHVRAVDGTILIRHLIFFYCRNLHAKIHVKVFNLFER